MAGIGNGAAVTQSLPRLTTPRLDGNAKPSTEPTGMGKRGKFYGG
jgi:hypothetical protein